MVGNVVFNNVDFSYDGKQILHDTKLYADKGQKVAFVRPGQSKTTITSDQSLFTISVRFSTYDGIDVS